MTLGQDTVPVASVAYASHAQEAGSLFIRNATARKEPGKERFSEFRFDQKVFGWEGGKFKLRLKEFLVVTLDPNTVRVRVKDWGIELNVGSAGDLPKLIVRRFLSLWSKAQNDMLSDADAECWETIVGIVDMQDFAVQQSQPRYIEGQLLSLGEVPRVKWHDGATSFIPRQFAEYFDILTEGEFFSAYVKFGRNDEPLSVERILPISAPAAA
jgi:hypothetical protein